MSEPPPPPYPGAPPYPSAPGAQYSAPPYPVAPYPEKGGVEPSAPGYMHPPPPQPMMHPQGYGQGPPPPQGPPGQAWVPPPPPNAWVPPPQGYGSVPSAPAAVPQNTTVVIQNRPYLCHFGEASVQTSCPKCKAEIMTATHYETGNLSWVICLVLSFFGCIFGCCLLPFCMDNTKDVIHSCPNCNNFIGRYSRL